MLRDKIYDDYPNDKIHFDKDDVAYLIWFISNYMYI